MSSGTQIDPPSPEGGYGGLGPLSVNVPATAGSGGRAYLTDEEILGIEPVDDTLSVQEDATAGAITTENATRTRTN